MQDDVDLEFSMGSEDVDILWEHNARKKTKSKQVSSPTQMAVNKAALTLAELKTLASKSHESPASERVDSVQHTKAQSKLSMASISMDHGAKRKVAVSLNELKDLHPLPPTKHTVSSSEFMPTIPASKKLKTTADEYDDASEHVYDAKYMSTFFTSDCTPVPPGPLPPTSPQTGRWTELERIKLYQATELYCREFHGRMSWKHVCMYLGNARTPTQCRDRWALELLRIKNPDKDIPPVITKWPEEVEDALDAAVQAHTFTTATKGMPCVRWKDVSADLQDRFTAAQCRRYWQAKQTVATGNWTTEEDLMLNNAIQRLGEPGAADSTSVMWKDISEEVKTGRTATQCRNRWKNCASMGYSLMTPVAAAPNSSEERGDEKIGEFNVVPDTSALSGSGVGGGMRHGWWTAEEDQMLLEGVRKYTSSARPKTMKTSASPRMQQRISWQDVAREALSGQRCPQQCLKRYTRLCNREKSKSQTSE